MRIYLVQAGGSLDGSDGYSNGLLKGEHRHLLVSFADFMGRQSTIHRKVDPNRRSLATRPEPMARAPVMGKKP